MEVLRKLLINQGCTKTAYLPVSFRNYHDVDETKTSSASSTNQKQGKDIKSALQALHHGVKKNLEIFLDSARKEIICQRVEGFLFTYILLSAQILRIFRRCRICMR